MRYINHFPKSARCGRFWRRWIPSKDYPNGGYFGQQVIGKNQISAHVEILLCECLDILPEEIQWEEKEQKSRSNDRKRFGVKRYTGHTPRRSIATICASKENISDAELGRFGRWKHPKTIERYKDNNRISRSNLQTKIQTNFVKIAESIGLTQEKDATVDNSISQGATFSFSNCTFNFGGNK